MSVELILVPGVFALIGFVVWVAAKAWQRHRQLKVLGEFQNRLLDRIGSITDWRDFLKSDAGVRIVDVLVAGRDSMTLRERLLGTLQTGVVLIALGLGFLFLSWRLAPDSDTPFMVVGVLAEALGLGFLLSAGAAYWAQRWTVPDAGPPSGDRGRDARDARADG